MAALLLLSPPPLSPSSRYFSSPRLPAIQDLPVLRRTERTRRRRCSVVVVSSSSVSSSPIHVPEDSTRHFQRRDLLLSGISTSLLLVLPISDAHAEIQLDEDLKASLLVDDINAYSFLYPMELPAKKFVFKWIESRKPERYSSAAPLSANARQRIVSERVDMIHNLVISVSIGPPNSRFLTSSDKKTWEAKDVADSVLSDKSALPVTTGQKMAESSVLDAHSEEIDGEPYWYYEYLVRKSPTKFVQGSNLFRHNVSATAERDGYLYSLNASTLSKQWDSIGPFLQKTVASFRLVPPTENYVPPYKDPWRFWIWYEKGSMPSYDFSPSSSILSDVLRLIKRSELRRQHKPRHLLCRYTMFLYKHEEGQVTMPVPENILTMFLYKHEEGQVTMPVPETLLRVVAA